MGDKLINQYDEKMPVVNDFALLDDGSGFYNKGKVGNFPGGGGSGAITLTTPTLTATPSGSSQINLSWTNVANESSYELQRSPNGSTGWTTINSPAVNVTSYNDTGLTASTAYYYRIRAIGDGVSYLSSGYGSANATTGSAGATQLSTPGSFAATPASSSQINLSWTDVANESSYSLEWSPNGSTGWTAIGGTIAAGTTSYNHTGLTASTAYYYRLKAVGNGTTFTDSNFATANATTSAGYQTESDAYFASNTGLTAGQKNALDAFVVSLKSIGWAKFKAVYLPVWGSAAANKWNLTNPADTDAAYRLSFSGGWTHGATGATPNGTTGYANTFVNPSTALSSNDIGFSAFAKGVDTSADNSAVLGAWTNASDASNGLIALVMRSSSDSIFYASSDTNLVTVAWPSSGDLFVSGNRTGASAINIRTKDASAGTTTNTSSTTSSSTVPNGNIYLGGVNNLAGSPTAMFNKEIQFAAIHSGLTLTESNSLADAWFTLKSALSI